MGLKLEAFKKLYASRIRIDDDNRIVILPCPYCAEPDFAIVPHKQMYDEHECKICGRAAKFVANKWVQTKGIDPPEWIPRKERTC